MGRLEEQKQTFIVERLGPTKWETLWDTKRGFIEECITIVDGAVMKALLKGMGVNPEEVMLSAKSMADNVVSKMTEISERLERIEKKLGIESPTGAQDGRGTEQQTSIASGGTETGQ